MILKLKENRIGWYALLNWQERPLPVWTFKKLKENDQLVFSSDMPYQELNYLEHPMYYLKNLDGLDYEKKVIPFEGRQVDPVESRDEIVKVDSWRKITPGIKKFDHDKIEMKVREAYFDDFGHKPESLDIIDFHPNGWLASSLMEKQLMLWDPFNIGTGYSRERIEDLDAYLELVSLGIHKLHTDNYGRVIVMLQPVEYHTSSFGLHSIDGPALVNEDSKYYMLHGVRFTKKKWEHIVSGKATVNEILGISNMEERRACMACVPPEVFGRESELVIISPKTNIALYHFKARDYFLIKYKDDSTDRIYYDFVPRVFQLKDKQVFDLTKVRKNDHEASKVPDACMAWKFNLTLDQYLNMRLKA